MEPCAQGPGRALPGPPGGAHGPPVLPDRRPGGHLLRRRDCQTVDAVHVRLESVQMGLFLFSIGCAAVAPILIVDLGCSRVTLYKGFGQMTRCNRIG